MMTREDRNHHNREQLAWAVMVLAPLAVLILAAVVGMCSVPPGLLGGS